MRSARTSLPRSPTFRLTRHCWSSRATANASYDSPTGARAQLVIGVCARIRRRALSSCPPSIPSSCGCSPTVDADSNIHARPQILKKLRIKRARKKVMRLAATRVENRYRMHVAHRIAMVRDVLVGWAFVVRLCVCLNGGGWNLVRCWGWCWW